MLRIGLSGLGFSRNSVSSAARTEMDPALALSGGPGSAMEQFGGSTCQQHRIAVRPGIDQVWTEIGQFRAMLSRSRKRWART